jgi:hypothetical protein
MMHGGQARLEGGVYWVFQGIFGLGHSDNHL